MTKEQILLGRGDRIVARPRALLNEHLAHLPEHTRSRLSFMTADHHRVRYHLVRHLPRTGKPLLPNEIASDLKLPLDWLVTILDDLERNLFFLVRDGNGSVAWAFPVTVEPTAHRISFSTGEQIYGA